MVSFFSLLKIKLNFLLQNTQYFVKPKLGKKVSFAEFGEIIKTYLLVSNLCLYLNNRQFLTKKELRFPFLLEVQRFEFLSVESPFLVFYGPGSLLESLKNRINDRLNGCWENSNKKFNSLDRVRNLKNNFFDSVKKKKC